MEGKSIIEKYIKFKIDFIYDFCKNLLPNKYFKFIDIKQTKDNLYKYYVDSKVYKYDISNMIHNSSEKELYLNSFYVNKIRISEVQHICYYLFDKKLLFTLDRDENKKIFIDLATTIYIALNFDAYILPYSKSKAKYEDIYNLIVSRIKSIIDINILIRLKERKDILKKVFNKYYENNAKFNNLMGESGEFHNNYIKVNSEVLESNLFMSHFKYDIKELTEENSNDLKRVTKKKSISYTMKRIELELTSYYLMVYTLCNKNIRVIIDIEGSFLSNINVSYINKILNYFKDNIIFKINFDDFDEYKISINNLKSLGFNVTYKKGTKSLEMKKIHNNKLLFVDYEESIEFNRLIDELKLNKIEPVVCNIPNNKKNVIKDRNICYYIYV